MAPTSAPPPTLSSVDLPSTLLLFGVPALVVLLLVLAALCGLLGCKASKQRRKRRKTEQEAKGRKPRAHPGPVPSSPGQVPAGPVSPQMTPSHSRPTSSVRCTRAWSPKALGMGRGTRDEGWGRASPHRASPGGEATVPTGDSREQCQK